MFFDDFVDLTSEQFNSTQILYDYAEYLNLLYRTTSFTRSKRKLFEEKESAFLKAFSSSFSKEISSGKSFWWRLRWEQIEPHLKRNTLFGESKDGWNFNTEWNVVGDKEQHILILREVGNCPGFSYEEISEHNTLSSYSESQQEDMRKEYNKKLTCYALGDILFHDDSPVRSPMGVVYGSRVDYYLSEEYFNDRLWSDWNYKRSLYVKHEKNTMIINSTSRYYQAVYAVASFCVDKGNWKLQLYPFRYCGGIGDIPQWAQTKYNDKDSAIAFVRYIESHPEYGALPFSLFTENLLKDSQSFEEAMRLAQIMCLLGNSHSLENFNIH